MSFIYRLNGPKNLTWQKQCNGHYCDHLDLGVNLIPELPESSYTAKVTATNRLGNASSFPSTFTFWDIGTFYFTFCTYHSLVYGHYFKNHLNVLYVTVSKGTVSQGIDMTLMQVKECMILELYRDGCTKWNIQPYSLHWRKKSSVLWRL